MADHDRDQQIRERAYFLWKKEGSPEGQQETHWQRATLLHDADDQAPISTPLQERSAEEAKVDEAMAETFPASDPPAFTPGAGVRSEE